MQSKDVPNIAPTKQFIKNQPHSEVYSICYKFIKYFEKNIEAKCKSNTEIPYLDISINQISQFLF